MNIRFKKVLALLLVLTMMFSMTSVATVLAADGDTEQTTTEVTDPPVTGEDEEDDEEEINIKGDPLTTKDGLFEYYKYELTDETAGTTEYILEIKLKTTAWSDGRQVSADDYVFAWKRLLEPEFASEAANMLYDIKNARAVKAGEMSIDDLGLYAADTTVLQVQFECDVDYVQFLKNCASIALYPLREDKVVKLQNWASNTATMVCNGPFFLKTYKPGESMCLERNIYYYRDVEKEESLIKYTIPYRLDITFSGTAADELAKYDAANGDLFFISELPLAARAARSAEATTYDIPITHTYVLNCDKAPFNKPEVRKALSLAIDRNQIVSIVNTAKAASGFVTDAAYRAAAGSVINASANMSEAQSLLSAAGVKPGKFNITVRNNEVDLAVAEYIKGVWGQLGFTVGIETLGTELYLELEYDQTRDLTIDAYRSGDFDVIAVDLTEFSSDPFNTFAMYSKPFSGGALDLVKGNYDYVPHVSGFSDDAYDALMEEIFAEKVIANRTTKLIEAEKKLAEAMPVIPLFQYQNSFLMSGELSGLSYTSTGYYKFNRVKLKDYLTYQTTAATAAAEGETEAAAE